MKKLLAIGAVLLAVCLWLPSESPAGPIEIPSVSMAAATNALNVRMAAAEASTNALNVRMTTAEASTNALNVRMAAAEASTNALNVRMTTAEGYFGALGETSIVWSTETQTNTFYFNAQGVLTGYVQEGP